MFGGITRPVVHLEVVFTANKIRYERGVVTEGKAEPDFLFPGGKEYRDAGFDAALLTMLGVKTTCKDRWRQVLAEAKRIERKHLHPRYETPGFSILAQGLWAAVLVVSGSYETLLDYAMFAMWFWYGLMVAGVIALRYKEPDLARPYRMWGYPVTPALFVAIACWFLVNMLNTRPLPSVAGLLLIATGIPVYFLWARQRNQAESTKV